MAFATSTTVLAPLAGPRARPAGARASAQPAKSARKAASQRLTARSNVVNGQALAAKQQTERAAARAVRVFAAVKEPKANSNTLQYTTPNLNMPVTLTRLPNSRMRLKAEVPLSFCETAYNEVVEECKKELKSIDGYRKGAKVPPKIVIREVGKDFFLNRIGAFIITGTLVEASQAVSESAMQDSERVVTPPDQIISNFSGTDLRPTGPSIYEFEVDVFPELKWTGDFRTLSVSVEAAGDAASEAKEVEQMILAKQKELSPLRVVADRGLAIGDTAVLNVDCHRVNADGSQGEPLDFATVRRLRLDTSEEQDIIPGFVEALVGLKVGEDRTFELVLPQNLGREDLRGQKARFRGSLLELFGRTLEPLTDALAPRLLGGCTTLKQVREELLKLTKMATEESTKARVRDALALALGDLVQVELPQSLVQESGRESYSADLLERQAKGQLDPRVAEQLLAPSIVQRHIDKNREKIERNVRTQLALNALAEELKIKPTEAEVEAAMKETREQFAKMGQEFDEERLRKEVEEGKLVQLTLEWLEKNSKVTVKPYAGA